MAAMRIAWCGREIDVQRCSRKIGNCIPVGLSVLCKEEGMWVALHVQILASHVRFI